MTKIRKYTVTSKALEGRGHFIESFPNLKKARIRGFEHYRAGRFISLININGISLPLM